MTLDFENDRANVEFTLEEGITAEMYTMKVYAADKTNGGEKKHVFTSREYPLIRGDNKWYIIIDYVFYNHAARRAHKKSDTRGSIRQTRGNAGSENTLPTILEFSFSVVIDDEENEIEDILEIHFVRYIPKLLNILGYTNGEKLQRIWFTEGNNEDKEAVDPKIDILEWDWIMEESSQAQKEYYDLSWDIKRKLNAWTDNKTKTNLRNEIQKMVANGLITLPTAGNSKVRFGVTDATIITYKNELMPAFEEYYFVSKPFGGWSDLGFHYLTDGLDDFIASLANFNYHVLATGELIFNEAGLLSGESITINVKQLGFYIKDRWDFIDDNPTQASQPLGYWKIVNANTVEAERNPHNKGSYYEVTNEIYRAYRDVHNMGYNYFYYSTIHNEAVNLEFTL